MDPHTVEQHSGPTSPGLQGRTRRGRSLGLGVAGVVILGCLCQADGAFPATRVAQERLDQHVEWSGDVVVERPVLVAPGATLHVAPGTKVRFARGAGLVIQGSLRASGTADSPIIFTGEGDSQATGTWAGLRFEGPAARGEIYRCDFRLAQNLQAGSSPLTIRDCRFGNGAVGVTVGPGAPVQVIGCTFTDMSQSAIVFESKAGGGAEGNTVERCGQAGITTDRDSRVSVRANKITGCQVGIAIQHNGSPVEGNQVDRCEVGVLALSAPKGAKITENRISNCRQGILCNQFSLPILENDEITDCQEGIVCVNASSPLIKNCTIRNNVTGIACVQISSPRINDNDILGNGTGIYLHLSSYAIVNNNNIYDNRIHMELGMMSSDWERRGERQGPRGLQARNATMVEQGRAVAEDMPDGARLMAAVDARGNWWGADTTAQLATAGPDANIDKIFDFFDVPAQTLEGRAESYVKDRVDYQDWKRERISGTGRRKGNP